VRISEVMTRGAGHRIAATQSATAAGCRHSGASAVPDRDNGHARRAREPQERLVLPVGATQGPAAAVQVQGRPSSRIQAALSAGALAPSRRRRSVTASAPAGTDADLEHGGIERWSRLEVVHNGSYPDT
jgi:hypothetical protein